MLAQSHQFASSLYVGPRSFSLTHARAHTHHKTKRDGPTEQTKKTSYKKKQQQQLKNRRNLFQLPILCSALHDPFPMSK